MNRPVSPDETKICCQYEMSSFAEFKHFVRWFWFQVAASIVVMALGLSLTASWRPQRITVGGVSLDVAFQSYWPGCLFLFASTIGLSIVSTLYRRNAQFCLVVSYELLSVVATLAALAMGIVCAAVASKLAGLSECKTLDREDFYYTNYGPSCYCTDGPATGDGSRENEFIFRDDCDDVLGKITDLMIVQTCFLMFISVMGMASSYLGCYMLPYSSTITQERTEIENGPRGEV